MEPQRLCGPNRSVGVIEEKDLLEGWSEVSDFEQRSLRRAVQNGLSLWTTRNGNGSVQR
jgi:hypothetical protein